MAYIWQYSGKCVTRFALTSMQIKRDVLGGACDEHIFFIIYTTEKSKVVWELCARLR